MQYRSRLHMAVLLTALLALFGSRALAAPPVFQPEVLLIKISGGQHRSFAYAKLKPAVPDAKTNTVTFKYKAAVDYVTCTIVAGAPDAKGLVHAEITVQRSATVDGQNPTFKTSKLDFIPGKAQIIDTQASLYPNSTDGALEMLQLSVPKPEAPKTTP